VTASQPAFGSKECIEVRMLLASSPDLPLFTFTLEIAEAEAEDQ